MSITIAQPTDLARRLGATDAELAEISWLFGDATRRDADPIAAAGTAAAYLAGYLRGTILVAGREHAGCTTVDCRACENLRRGLAAMAEYDAVYAPALGRRPAEDDLHTDMHPEPGDAPAAPIPAGVEGHALGRRTGEHPIVRLDEPIGEVRS